MNLNTVAANGYHLDSTTLGPRGKGAHGAPEPGTVPGGQGVSWTACQRWGEAPGVTQVSLGSIGCERFWRKAGLQFDENLQFAWEMARPCAWSLGLCVRRGRDATSVVWES